MKVAILGEQNFNEVDGSTIWLLNLCKLMADLPGMEVTFLSAHPLLQPVLLADMPRKVSVVDPTMIAEKTGQFLLRLAPETLTQALRSWEQQVGRFDRYFVRGARFLAELLESPDFCNRIIAYTPGLDPGLSCAVPEWLHAARNICAPLVVQSRASKSVMETIFEYPAHLLHVLPPVVYPMVASAPRDPARSVLCYSGKIDLHYGLDWLIALARQIDPDASIQLSMIAGKDAWRDRAPDFFEAMDQFRADIEAGRLPHVSLQTNLSHELARAQMAQADFAWGLRHDVYDDVLEISTKMVEFCAAGVVPIVNDTALNRSLFGRDYPYLVDIRRSDAMADVLHMLRSKGSPEHLDAQARVLAVAKDFSAAQLSPVVERILKRGVQSPAMVRKRHILLAAHDLKFLNLFLDQVAASPVVQITHQPWVNMAKPARPPMVPDDVDTVFCEWACENAVWHSHNKRPDTRLIVRLHRFEAFEPYPARMNWAAVDVLIVVSEHFRDFVIERFGVSPDRVHVWPQFIDWTELQRPKLPLAPFTIGMVGIKPFDHKRFDRAIDFFAALRAQEPRFRMLVRSLMPWQVAPLWAEDSPERTRFTALFQRIQTDPLLAGAIRFDPPGPDMEEWYRSVGVILSSSDSEGCHTAVTEGMASGCYPVVQDWPGAHGLYAPYVHADLRAAIADVIAFAYLPQKEALARRAAIAETMRGRDVSAFTQWFFTL